MTKFEWTKFVFSLELSVRAHNLMLRAYREPTFKDYEDMQTDKYSKDTVQLYECISHCDSVSDVLENIDFISKRIDGFGVKTYSEIVDRLEEKRTEKIKEQTKIWHQLSEELPEPGVPLMCKVYDTIEDKMMCKYPVYYCKNPYSLEWEWIWLNESGICRFLSDYTGVNEWAYIEDVNGINEV